MRREQAASLSALGSYLSLYNARRFRQEARKSWDYVRTDHIVYAPEKFEAHTLAGVRYLEQDLASDIWFEVLFGIATDGNAN